MKKMNLLCISLLWIPAVIHGQKNGNMDQWVTRKIHESKIIGGQTRTLNELGPVQTMESNEPYTNLGGSPWANSNVMARISGITKTNTSIFPEKRNGGYCARMETRMESIKVLGDQYQCACHRLHLPRNNAGTGDRYKESAEDDRLGD